MAYWSPATPVIECAKRDDRRDHGEERNLRHAQGLNLRLAAPTGTREPAARIKS